jgi:thioredoxin-related protein
MRRPKLATKPRALEYFSILALTGAMFIVLTASNARAAELVMFEQAGCSWCEAFDRDIGTIYGKTEDSLRAPLRRVDISRALPPDLSFIQVERLTPLFVLVDKGREIGRIRGYGDPEAFWTQLFMLMEKLDKVRTDKERARRSEKTLRAPS